MARPTTIDTERVIEVARRAFLDHGFTVSTATIARELGISEGSIYKRFPTKQELFQAAMGLPSADFALAWPDLAGDGEPRDHLLAIGDRLLAHFRELIPRTVMLYKTPCCHPLDVLRESDAPPPFVVLGSLAEFLRREHARGVLHVAQPEVAARMFIGALHTYVFFQLIRPKADPPGDDDYVGQVVDTLLAGIAR